MGHSKIEIERVNIKHPNKYCYSSEPLYGKFTQQEQIEIIRLYIVKQI